MYSYVVSHVKCIELIFLIFSAYAFVVLDIAFLCANPVFWPTENMSDWTLIRGVWTTIFEVGIVVEESMKMKTNHEDAELIGNLTVIES